jgi:aminopeptidase
LADPRIAQLARVLVRYSLELQDGDLLLIRTTPQAAPLVRGVYREALVVGAHPAAHISLEEVEEVYYQHASSAQLQYVSPLLREQYELPNAVLFIGAEENTKFLTGIAPEKVALRAQALHPLRRRLMADEARWTITRFPTQAAAQDAEMSLAEYEAFVYAAGKLHENDPVAAWRRVHDEQQRIADLLKTKQTIRLVGPGTDLTYSTAGRAWLNADGSRNFPDGEVFTSPDETRTEGTVRFSYPAVHEGREVEDVRLVFREGQVVEATATKGQDLLETLLNTDAGARRLGEAAFGLNYDIGRFTRSILFDEKIGGTIHLALGEAFPQIGGRNRSVIHIDLVCDMREGEAYADGELVYKNGRFLI